MTQTRNLIPAEIVLTSAEGQVFAFVNGERVAAERDGKTVLARIEKSPRAAHVYRQTGYVAEAGAMIAEGQRVVVA